MMETIILQNLITNNEYFEKIYSYLKDEYFVNEHRIIFSSISNFYNQYNKIPTLRELIVETTKSKHNQTINDKLKKWFKEFKQLDDVSYDWLLTNTQSFCQKNEIDIAIQKSLEILSKSDKDSYKTISSIITKAVNISFEPKVGHDYIDDISDRIAYYSEDSPKLSTGFRSLDLMFDGGLSRKTLTVLLAAPGVGKSAMMCNLAANYLRDGRNVCYISMEMAKEEISQRIDLNLLDMSKNAIIDLARKNSKKLDNIFRDKLQNIQKGSLMIEEFASGDASIFHFKKLLDELHIRKGFKPDVIVVDYLQICASGFIARSNKSDKNLYYGEIAKELRSLAKEYDCVMITASQVTKGTYASGSITMADTASSVEINNTADNMVGIIASDTMKEKNLIKVSKVKSRNSDDHKNKHFTLKFDKEKQRFTDNE
jgi:replicative DNA helicase